VTEKTNNKQKNKKIVLALVWNLPVRRLFGGVLVVWNFLEICLPAVFLAGCLEFVILDTKLQGRARHL
jgi:hypothetical protein